VYTGRGKTEAYLFHSKIPQKIVSCCHNITALRACPEPPPNLWNRGFSVGKKGAPSATLAQGRQT